MTYRHANELLTAARELYGSDDVEMDPLLDAGSAEVELSPRDASTFSKGHDGTWVRAWLWVPHAAVPKTTRQGS